MVIANMLTYHAETTLRALRNTKMNYGEIRETIKSRLIELIADRRSTRLNKGAMDKNERIPSEMWLEQFQRYDTEHYDKDDIVISQSNRRIDKLFPQLSLTNEQREQFIKEFIRQYPKALKAILAFDKTPNDIDFTTQAPEIVSQTKLNESVEKFVAAQLRGGKWKPHTERERRRGLAFLVELLGHDFYVEKLDKKAARDIRDTINALPMRYKQNKLTKHLAIREAIKVESVDKISPKTANEYIGSCSAFGQWLDDEGYIDKNPFMKMKTTIKENTNKRKAFTQEEIALILNALEHNDIKGNRKSFRYWGSLIALYSGARLEEICQLQLDDIEQHENLWCFNINDDGDKNVKSKSSKRIIPIHSAILDKGFINHVKTLRDNSHTRLFPELKRSPNHGYGRPLSNWFNTKFLVDLNIKTKSIVFHSLRHTVATGLGEAGINDSLQKRILGHSMANNVTAGYDKSMRLGLMKDAIEKLPY